MLQVESFISENQNELVYQINYFLKQIDDILVKDIKYSSFAFSNGTKNVVIFTALIIYLVK